METSTASQSKDEEADCTTLRGAVGELKLDKKEDAKYQLIAGKGKLAGVLVEGRVIFEFYGVLLNCKDSVAHIAKLVLDYVNGLCCSMVYR